jgi:hypothetical protein
MQDFINNLSSPYWWISIVVVGLILNIISAYFRDAIDTVLSRMSTWWSKRSDKRKNKREDQITSLIGDKDAQHIVTISEFRNRIRALYYLILGMSLITVSQFITLIQPDPGMRDATVKLSSLVSGSFIISISLSYFLKAVNEMGLVSEARQKEIPDKTD